MYGQPSSYRARSWLLAGAATHLILKGAQKVSEVAEPFMNESHKDTILIIGATALAIGAGYLTLKCALAIITGHSTIMGSQNAVAIAACHFSQKGAEVVQSVAQSLLNLTPELKSIILGTGIGALATNNKLRPFILFTGMGALAGGLLNLISKASQAAERAII